MASSLTIKLEKDPTVYLPGERLSGRIDWSVSADAKGVCLRLFWFTSGRGTQDIQVEEELDWDVTNGSTGSETFHFDLPAEPYTFSGKLISLTWALEAVVLPGEESEKVEFVVSPSGQAIELQAIEDPASS